MEDIVFHFIGENSKEKAAQLLENLIRKTASQYSYTNCWVMEEDGEIIAAAVVYDGAKLHELRKPVAEEIKTMFNKDFCPEDETRAGEFYIDCIGVNPQQQRKGFGSKLLRFLIDEYAYKKYLTLGMLVDKDNPDAKKLYLRLGFKAVGEQTLAGNKMEHLQLSF